MDYWVRLEEHTKTIDYDHYSFDFWRTIAFSNPQFKESRAKLIIDLSGGRRSQEKIDNAFSIIGSEYNRRMEEENHFLRPHMLYAKVFDELQIDCSDIMCISENIDQLFLDYPPLISTGFERFYRTLNKNGKTTSISSNTAFVGGEVIRRFLIDRYPEFDFDFMLFSDIEEIAKPNAAFFDLMRSEIVKVKGARKDGLRFIHIGDNENTDVKGAEMAGGKGYFIKDYSEYGINES